MTDKAPEELAQESFNKIPLIDSVKKHAPEIYEKSHFWYAAGFEEGYAAALPKWVSASDTQPGIRKMCLGHFEVTPDYWSTPFIVFFAEVLPDTESLMFLDQCGNHLPPEFKRLLEYLELPPTKET